MKTADYENMGEHRKLTYVCTLPEKKRVYIFPGGDRIEIENVVEARASRHGNHQLITQDGTVHVIPWGWISLSFPAEASVPPKEVLERGEQPYQDNKPADPGTGCCWTATDPGPCCKPATGPGYND